MLCVSCVCLKRTQFHLKEVTALLCVASPVPQGGRLFREVMSQYLAFWVFSLSSLLFPWHIVFILSLFILA